MKASFVDRALLRIGFALIRGAALADRAGRAMFKLGWRLVPTSFVTSTPADDSLETEAPPQDPLTPEAAAMLHGESVRMGAETFDDSPLDALRRNVNGPDEFVVGEKRVHRQPEKRVRKHGL